jgi:hypothetical protein
MTTIAARRPEELKDLEVSVRPEQVLRAHYPDLAPVAAEVRATAAAMAAHALEIARPLGWLRQVAVRAVGSTRVELEGDAVLNSATLANLLRESSAVQLFVVTLGPQIDARVHQLFEAMDGLEGLFLDTAGWVAVQSALSAVRKRCAAKARSEGYRLTRRIGPGYLDWPLEEQAIVFRALAGGDALAPIEVLESGAILPEKTLTGLFGLIPQAKE